MDVLWVLEVSLCRLDVVNSAVLSLRLTDKMTGIDDVHRVGEPQVNTTTWTGES